MRAKPSQVSKDTARTLSFSILASIVAVLTGIVVAKGLGPAGKGIFAGVQLAQSGLIAATGGIGAGITYLLTKQKRPLGELIGALAALTITVSFVAWLLLGLWGLHFGVNTTVVIVALIVPASIILSWQPYYFMGLGRITNLNFQSLGLAVGTLITVAIAIFALHLGINGALAVRCLCIYVAAGVVVAHALRLGGHISKLDFGENFRQLVKFGSSSGLGTLLGFFNSRLDSLILIALLGASGFGVYSIAVAAGELLFLISRAVNTATSNAIGSLDRQASAAMTAKAARTTKFVMALVALPLITIAPPLIPLVYGARFEQAGVAMMILLPGVVVFAGTGAISSFLSFQMGRPIVLVYFSLVTVTIEAVSCLLLIPRLGMNGAAIGSSFTYFCAAAFRTWYFCRTTKISPADIWIIHKEDFAILGNLRSLLLPTNRAR
jgi:O-antigen/teichoic acid export membrane protein